MPLHPNFATSVSSMLTNPIALWAIAALASATSVHALTIAPFTAVEATYTDANLNSSNSVYGDGLDGYEVGVGVTFGARINGRHEVSFSTGLTEWNGTPSVTPGFVRTEVEAQQIPVLLNYRYHLPLDSKGRYTLFLGPTAGFIHQKITVTNHQLGGLPANLVGSDSSTDWVFAYGAAIGVNAQLTTHWTAGVSAQVLKVASSDFTSFGGAGPFGHFDSVIRPSFSLSLSYGW